MNDSPSQWSTLGLAVLSLLGEAELIGDGTMHPYRMQQLIKERGKDQVVNVGQRASLYRTIERLRRSGLVEARETVRESHRPERTMYALTDEGRRAWREWMVDALARPAREYPKFPAAISFIPLLAPEEVLAPLERRREVLREELEGISAQAEDAAVPRLFLLETEYLRTVTRAELEWVTAVIDDLRRGRLAWSREQLRALADADADAGER